MVSWPRRQHLYAEHWNLRFSLVILLYINAVPFTSFSPVVKVHILPHFVRIIFFLAWSHFLPLFCDLFISYVFAPIPVLQVSHINLSINFNIQYRQSLPSFSSGATWTIILLYTLLVFLPQTGLQFLFCASVLSTLPYFHYLKEYGTQLSANEEWFMLFLSTMFFSTVNIGCEGNWNLH